MTRRIVMRKGKKVYKLSPKRIKRIQKLNKEILAITKRIRTQEKGKYRIWVHPKSGDDYYFLANKIKVAQKLRRTLLRSRKFNIVERPLKVK